MNWIEPHIHTICRPDEDYVALSELGCNIVGEPAFWAGFDRPSVQAFHDYFHQLTHTEPLRAKQWGITYYTWICLNPKEAQNLAFARDVMQIIPEFLACPNVLGIGEIGLNRNTKNELTIFEEHLDIAIRHGQLILIHTPHLEDKLKGTQLIIAALKNRPEIDPSRVLIDHCEEHTIQLAKDYGAWAGLTLYPITKLTPKRAANILETFGPHQTWINSAADWGPSTAMSVPYLMQELTNRGHSQDFIYQIVRDNPRTFMSQSLHFG